MSRFGSILVLALFTSLSEVWTTKDSATFDLYFVTWPNDTATVVNHTVEFEWKYFVRGKDVNVKWGLSKPISRNVGSFDRIFFTATNYEATRKAVLNSDIPDRYRGRVKIIGQATLQIVNVTLEDEGSYLCEIKDTGEAWTTLSRAAKLHVLIPPKIESHPRETILKQEGEELKIGCKASGIPRPVVKWSKDGEELTEDVGSSEYTKAKVSMLDAGNYICQAENNASTLSRDQYIVQVIVQYKPFETKIKTDAKSDTVKQGEDLKIVCEAQASPDPTFTFFHYTDTKIKKELNDDTANTGEIYIKNIKPSDRGYYSCIPKNYVGVGAEAKIFVTVKYSPRITSSYPRFINLTKNDPLKLTCDADGFPNPRVNWFKDKIGPKILATGNVFQKGMVHEKDAGLYICEASNGNPPSARKEVQVNIFYKPVIDKKLSSPKVPAKIGDQLDLKCVAYANPPPSFEWKKGRMNRLGFKSTFTINSLTKDDLGIYTCEVSNTKGATTYQIEVFEIEQPAVGHLRVKKIVPRSAYLTWKLSGNKQFPIKRQVISYGIINEEESTIKSIKGEKKQTYKFEKLVPYTTYVVKIKAWNEYIASDEEMTSFKTATTNPGQPGRPKVEITTHTTVNVSWPPPKEPNGVLVEYLLEYSLINNTHWNKEKTPGTVNFKILKGLKYGETYKFKVRASTSAGKGLFSRTTEFPIGITDPSIPRDLKVIETSENIYVLEWKKPLEIFGKTVKISVNLRWKVKHSGRFGEEERVINVDKHRRSRITREQSFDWVAEMKQTSSIRKLEFRYLFPNTEYSVSVKEGMQAKNGIRWSGTSSDIGIETSAGVPSQPIDLIVKILTDKTFRLAWKRPLYSGGKLKKYTIFYRKSNERWTTMDLLDDLKNESVSTNVDVVDKDTQYHFKVQATGHKRGLFSRVIEFTQESDFLKPEVESHSADGFSITWTKPKSPWNGITMYTIYYRAENEKWQSKDVVSGLENKTLNVNVKGLKLGARYQVKLQASSSRFALLSKEYTVEPVNVSARGSDDPDYAPLFGGIVAGVLIFAFVIIVVAMYIRYNYRKRQRNIRRTPASSRTTPGVLITRENGHTHMSSPSDHLSTDSPGSEKYLRPERKGNSVQVPMTLLGGGTKAIPIVNLSEYYNEHRKDGNKGLSQEFKSLDIVTNYSYNECKKDVNKSKNRYANIVTYDHTRVCLSNLGEAGSDYINANYVDGYNCTEKFIATQGPVLTTFNDFWRMVWEQNCSAIVMVTNLIEKGKVKCQKYWPVTEAELYGAITIHPIEEWELTDYTIRKFQMQQNNNTELVRDVTQFHYTAWPDHGVPIHHTRFLAFIRRLQNYFLVTGGKIAVHCSAGVGRTGTFIALDGLLEQMRNEGVVDIHGFVSHMRTQRNAMVQTEAQYSFIYEAILEAAVCGETEIAVPDFKERFKALFRATSGNQQGLLAKEFENIKTLSTDEKETFVSALAQDNKRKNRCNSILPYDSNRVKLWPYPTEKGSDYINASFIDGYRNREIFIATQAPLKKTQEDYWRMAWEYECYVLVMLCNPVENQEVQCSQYWPSEGEEYLIFGLLMIEMETVQEYETFIKRKLKCTNTKSGEVRNIYHLHYTSWTENKVPDSTSSFLDFIKEILKLEQQTGNGLTMIHCSDGSSRVGTLVTIYIALERLKLECIIDVFSIVRNLRTERVGTVENLEQYRFCYQALQDYLQSPKSPAITAN